MDGLLVVTPYYNKTTQKGVVEHFKAISENTNLPIIVYNVPSRTGLDILPNTYLELSKMSNIVATKEASGDISKVLKIRKLCKDNLNVYSGNDDQIIPASLLQKVADCAHPDADFVHHIVKGANHGFGAWTNQPHQMEELVNVTADFIIRNI